ncbi:MAG: methanogenesis marker 17 protein [Methanoregula sp.]|jgi:putative methanogenesis marker protein 17|nr:methanogenesis marker 17 protein [Methanoregula sp.]
MPAVDYFEVECDEKKGAEYYRQIANDVLLDHNLLRVIDKLHIFIDPKVPLFIATGTLKKITTRVRVRDFANINPQEGKMTLVISDETYLAPMLKIFWQRFGKERVDQPDRFTVILNGLSVDPKEIEEIVVADPSESVFKDLIYAFRCIAPEGFRIRKETYGSSRFSFVASENILAEDIDDLVAAKFALMGETP